MKRRPLEGVWALMRFLVYFLFLFSFGSLSVAAVDEPFEGRIDYAVNSGGMQMTYSLWVKGSLWRSELKSGSQLYELRMGNSESGEAYLVNSGGQSYRALGGMPGMQGMGPREREGPRRAEGDKKRKGLDLEKLVSVPGDAKRLLDFEVRKEQVRGPGKNLDFWWTDELGRVSAFALPHLKGFEDKERVLRAYFAERGDGIPLEIEIPKAKGKNAFSMTAVTCEPHELEVEFLSLPDGYKLEVGGRPLGGGGGHGGRGGPPPGGGGEGRPHRQM